MSLAGLPEWPMLPLCNKKCKVIPMTGDSIWSVTHYSMWSVLGMQYIVNAGRGKDSDKAIVLAAICSGPHQVDC